MEETILKFCVFGIIVLLTIMIMYVGVTRSTTLMTNGKDWWSAQGVAAIIFMGLIVFQFVTIIALCLSVTIFKF